MPGSIEPGETFGASCVVDAEDLELAVRLTRGRHPVHVSDAAARQSGLQGRIFHGAVSAAIMTAAIGQRFERDTIALLEQSQRYRKPVYPGDTLTSHWLVQSVEAGRPPGTRFIELSGELRNQRDEVVLEGEARVLLRRKFRNLS